MTTYDCGTCNNCTDRIMKGRNLPLNRVCLYAGKAVCDNYCEKHTCPCGDEYYDGDFHPAHWEPKK